jgi:hypothetical protein
LLILNNVLTPDQTHQEYGRGITSHILATAIPSGGGGGDVTSEEFLDLKQAQGILAIQQAISAGTTVNSNYLYAVDEYEDETGISTAVATYESGTSSYRTSASSTHSLLVQSEESGTVTDGNSHFYDSSGNVGKPLTANGNAQTEIPTLDSPYTDDSSLGIVFDGTDDYVESAEDSGTFPSGTTDFTMEAWVKPADVTGGKFIVGQWQGASGDLGCHLRLTGSELEFYSSVSGGNPLSNLISSGAGVVANVWQHVAVDRSVNTLRMYLDGVVVYTNASFTDNINNSSLSLKTGGYASTGAFFDGSIADVRVFGSSAEYEGAFTPLTTSPTFGTEDAFVWGSTATGNIEDQASNTLTVNGDTNVVASPYGGSEPVLLLDGTGDYVSAPDSANWYFTGDFTIQAKAKADSTSGGRCIVSQWLASGNERAWNLEIVGSEVRFGYSTNGTDNLTTEITSGAGIAVNTWYDIAVTLDTGTTTLKIWVDGVAVYTNASFSASLNDSTADLNIGALNAGSGDLFDGRISDVRIYNGTAETITDLTSKPAVTTEDFYLDHDITNTTFTDASLNHTPTANGGVRHTLANSKFGNSSMYFDGTDDYISVPDSTDWDFGAGSFTIEAQVYPTDISGTHVIASQWESTTADRAWRLNIIGGEIAFVYYNTGPTIITTNTTSGSALVANQWQHIAVDVDTDTNTLRIYLDGVVEYTNASFTDTIRNSAEPVRIGWDEIGTQYFDGLMEEVSVLKGTARYNGAFTAPTEPYSVGVSDLELDSITFTAGTAPTKATFVVVMEPIDSVTINTDFIAYVSPTASFANKGTFTLTYAGVDPLSGGNIYTSDDLDISGLTSGTSLRYYLRGANSKDLRVHAIYLYYAD